MSKINLPKVPKAIQVEFTDIVFYLQKFCNEKLNDEYFQLHLKLASKIARKRLSPFHAGKTKTWAAGIAHAIGMVNFLFDKSQKPHITSNELAAWFSLSQNTIAAKSKEIRTMFRTCQMDPPWSLPSRVADNPLVWMVMIDGYIIDVRKAPYEMQVEAFEAGIIPYIPGKQPAAE